MKKQTREWVRKAEKDHALAEIGSRSEVPFHDDVCFHCQQCAEKYLKAMLEELGWTIPRTHNLDELLNLLLPSHPTLHPFRRGLIFLTDFAVDTRYPGRKATKRQAASALRWASRIRDACRTVLGVRPRRRRKAP